MKQYLDVMEKILTIGKLKGDRTGVGTWSVFGEQMRFDLLHRGFPLVTTKKVHLKSVIHELLWFLQGADNNTWLKENGVTIWDEWADEDGYLGPIYGYQWRSWPVDPDGEGRGNRHPGIDQIAQLVDKLRNNPEDRRQIVSAWNVSCLDEMRLPPCHLLFQTYSVQASLHERLLWHHRSMCEENAYKNANLERLAIQGSRRIEAKHYELSRMGVPERALSLQMYQRSCDWFLGVPFNIASYSLLLMMLAQCTDHIPHQFIWTGGDCHLYLNHESQARQQLVREPYTLPWMAINPAVKSIDDFRYDDFTIMDYKHHDAIKAPIAV